MLVFALLIYKVWLDTRLSKVGKILSSAIIVRDSLSVWWILSLPTDLKEMDENVVTALDSVLKIPSPLIPIRLREQPVNITKAVKNKVKRYINLFFIE
jgi:hypothetical protein